MSSNTRPTSGGKSVLHRVIYLLLASTTLCISINSYDSSILKKPLMVLFSSLLVAVFVAQGVRRQKLELRTSPAVIVALMFLCLMLASLFYSKHQWESTQALGIWVPFIVCFFAGTQLYTTRGDFNGLFRAIAGIAALVCAVGLIQFFFSDRLFLDFFVGKGLRVTSTLTNPVYLGGYLALILPALLSFALTGERSLRERWLLGILLCGLAFLLVVTSTRSSMVAFLASIGLFGILSRQVKNKTFMWATLGVLLGVAVAAYISPAVIERVEKAFQSESTSSMSRRWYFWDAGYNAFKASPFLGHGIGSYETVMLDYRSPEYWIAKSEDTVPHAHNELIETAADLGSAGIVLYLVIVVMVLAAGLRTRPKESPDDRMMRIGLSCSLIAIFIDNLVNISLRVEPVGACAWLFMGMLASMSSRPEPGPRMTLDLPGTTAQVWRLVPAIWLVFAVWYAVQKKDAYEADGHMIRGILAEQANGLAMSITEYQRAVQLNPRTLVARSNLTLALLKARRADDALRITSELQALSPHYPKSNLMRAAALIAMHRNKEALEAIGTELKLRNHPDAYMYEAFAYRGLSDTAGELAALEDLLHASARGKILYQPVPVSRRVLDLVKSDEEIKRFTSIYGQINTLFPSDTSAVQTLAAFRVKLEDPARRAEPLPRRPPGSTTK